MGSKRKILIVEDDSAIARGLQQIADPGHVTISESVYDAIRGKIRLRTLRVDSRTVRNIKQPVMVYRGTI
jgi:class 3 adenylate cyclase